MKPPEIVSWIPVIYLYGIIHSTSAGECENATVTYEVDRNYDVINVARTIPSHEFRCWTFDLQAPKVEEPDMVLQVNIRSRPSGLDPGGSRTDRCYDGGSMDIIDGEIDTLLFVICSDTSLEYSDQIYSYGRNLTINVTSEAYPEVIEFDIWAKKQEDVPDGYYNQFDEHKGGFPAGVYVGSGIGVAVVLMCIWHKHVENMKKKRAAQQSAASSGGNQPSNSQTPSQRGGTAADLSSNPPSYDTVAGQRATEQTTATTQAPPPNPARQTNPHVQSAATNQPPPQNPSQDRPAGRTSGITTSANTTQTTENDTNLENGVFRLSFEVTGTLEATRSLYRPVRQDRGGSREPHYPRTLSPSTLVQVEEDHIHTLSSIATDARTSSYPPRYTLRPTHGTRPTHPGPYEEPEGEAPPTYDSLYPGVDPQHPHTSDC